MLTATPTYKVVIVNGHMGLLELFETVLDATRCDVVFVESSAHAYSQIKRVQPNLVVLCLQMDDAEGFQVLSMLQLDDETKAIPVVTCTSEFDGQELEHASIEVVDPGILDARPEASMN
jgi:CheY-like chemotaxis protein